MAILLTAMPSPAGAQSSKRGARKPAASERGGPLAFLFPRKRSEVPPAPAADARPAARSGTALPPKRAAVAPGAATGLAPGGAPADLLPVPRRHPRQVRVFILGDSQGHTEFGAAYQRELLMGGHEVLFHAVKNGSPYYWSGMWQSPVLTRVFAPAAEPEEGAVWEQESMRPHSISRYVEVYDPDVFIFQGGTNFELDLARDAPDQIAERVRNSVSEAASRGARVLWIGPPDARDDVKTPEFQEKAAATLRAALEGTTQRQGFECFFDSRPVCPMPHSAEGDGEHPGPAAARAWARAAGAWTVESIRGFQADKSFTHRKPATLGMAPVSPLVADLARTPPAARYTMKLRLVGKSRVEDPKTMAYTDAFSVFKYELQNPEEVLSRLEGLTLTAGSSSAGRPKAYQVYVLHWTAHHDGKRAAKTRVASRREGSTVRLQLTPLDQHPLRQALGTMRQTNDFDDFDAPIFVASDLLEERKP